MEMLLDTVFQALLTVFGGVLTFFASKLGAFMGKWLKEKEKNDVISSICRSCVYAVEQMYRDCGGEEKLLKALEMGEAMLLEKGIKISADTLRCLLESALAEAKGAFEKA